MHDDVKEALRSLTKVLADSKVGPGHGKKLESAKRELLTVARSGKVERRRVFRIVENVATVLLEIVEQDSDRRQG